MTNTLFPQMPIILVDDEEQILMSYDLVLRMAGYNHVISFSDSRKVMEQLGSSDAELLLLVLSQRYI